MTTDNEPELFSMRDSRSQTEADRSYARRMNTFWDESLGTNLDRLRNFPKYVPRQNLSSFLARADLFQWVLHLHGHIIECGVFLGGGVLTWAQLSAVYEPINHSRRVIGFDTFEGFVHFADEDGDGGGLDYAHAGGLATGALADIEEAVRLYDLNRPLGHIPRVELVAGDAAKTMPAYLEASPHLVVALLYLDFDLYGPTRAAIDTFLPRMPRGAILAFDELNQAAWPGETLALLETIGIRNVAIQRVPYVPNLSFVVLD